MLPAASAVRYSRFERRKKFATHLQLFGRATQKKKQIDVRLDTQTERSCGEAARGSGRSDT